MVDALPRHMTDEQFRQFGRELIDWIAGYAHEVERWPVAAEVSPGQIAGQLPDAPPLRGEPFEDILRDFHQQIMPGITHWQSPSFFGYFPANTSGPSILGELLSAGLGVQGMLWATSPACTELETRVLDWLVQAMDLPERFASTTSGGGVIQDTASTAGLCAVLAARERCTGFDTNRDGVSTRLGVYTSAEAHSLVEKAVKIAGIGSRNLRKIGVDQRFAMDPRQLAAAIEADVAAGVTPCLVCATVGTTSSNAMDPLVEIGQLCKRHRIWLHVDAAMSGTAALCPEFRSMHEGLERADSYCFNPHKWMLTNFDCSCLYVADRSALIDTFGINPEYLRNPASDGAEVFDYRDWQIALGRRFRALKLWFVIRHYGIEGLQRHLRHHVALAQRFAEWVADHPQLELVVPPPLNLVCFRHVAGDETTRRMLAALNATGSMYLTHSTLAGRYVIRFCVGQTHTELHHVEAAWKAISEEANKRSS